MRLGMGKGTTLSLSDTVLAFDRQGEITNIWISGEIEYANVNELKDRIESSVVLNGGLVISLERCTLIDSSGLTMMIQLHRRFPERFALVLADRTHVQKTFTITGLHKTLPTFASMEEAMRHTTTTAVSA